jgi:hypothetical protein
MKIYSRSEIDRITSINHSNEFTLQECVGERFITIDNFLENPKEFADFLRTFPAYSNDDYRIGGLPGWKQEIPRVFMTNLTEHLSSLFDVGSNKLDISWSTNIYSGRMPSRDSNYLPHVDHCPLVFNLWLNEDCRGGTRFYSLGSALAKKDSEDYLKDYYASVKLYPVLEDWKAFDGDENYHLYYTAEMKYNRIVIYNGNLWHSPYIEPNWYIDSFRYSLIGFTEDDYDD